MEIFREAENEGIFRKDAGVGKKFFVTFPYPYMNGFLHLGHLYSLMKAEAMARYKRMAGHSVLFPFAFHATGMPIMAAAQRIAEGEEKQKRILEMMGISEEDIPKFSDPKHWIEFFPEQAKTDLKRLGLSVDWRRSFTTVYNPHYSAFVSWQFRKLKEKGFVQKGRHPVVWCPKDRTVVGDHARLKGEGVMPEEMIMVKFRAGNYILPAATFRPETVFGVTNLWINPSLKYVAVDVNGEKWIVVEEAVQKLKDQLFRVGEPEPVKAEELLGMKVRTPTGSEVPVLEASFVRPDFGTGVVMSVPGHAPYDYVALKQSSRTIEPIFLIEVEGKHLVEEMVEEAGITDQLDPRLEELTNEIYKKEFHKGILNDVTGEFSGLTVQEAKPKIIEKLMSSGDAERFYDLTEEVVCRCLTRCHVKIVEDQWFLKYSDERWKEMAKRAISKMKIYPEQLKNQFLHVVDWLEDWACARKFGLGTKLPWDPEWVIESLSDSTIYMAYYTIAHLIKKVENPGDDLFDYVFLGKGDRKELSEKYDIGLLDRMREEFNYWYPMDLRVSGKDLIQNHLTMMVFNHVAIFPEEKWPAGIAVNGHVMVNGEKMSKSKGNFFTIRQLLDKYSADAVRFVACYAGEGVDDANFDTALCKTMETRIAELESLLDISRYSRTERRHIDEWFEQKVKSEINEATMHMEKLETRSALLHLYFNIHNALKWYMKRDEPNRDVMKWFAGVWLKALSPFIPEATERIWRRLTGKKWIYFEEWPVFPYEEQKPDTEGFIISIINDARNVIKLVERKGMKPSSIEIFIAEPWKFRLVEMAMSGKNLGEIMKMDEMKRHGKEAAKIYQYARAMKHAPPARSMQFEILEESRAFLERELGMPVRVSDASNSENPKARASTPEKPGILVETI